MNFRYVGINFFKLPNNKVEKIILSHNIVKQLSSLIQVMSKFNTHNIPLTSLSPDPSLTAYPHDKREIGVCGGLGREGKKGRDI
jgi:hypothetical protein